ncbi:VWA domain-containing protein [Haloferax volcanii]|uniref:ATP-dependent cobaltochelatase subunit ChlID n=2 Tax=Haloferax volcanii TaxID=2246 RepID=D4GP53_HALVD|nr:VWA domain-containing protein [Haloferax volcanii]ADE01488.1 ATP-dependent cobaltochelatase subunit ChlID [Haloferax volcanii DS2]MBS8118134.1 VWA domain-containing protein [Haloferax volcanii]MBS8123146.1 VWA domain-containing protein [Haloferax volcanii]MBS8127014.1 VWA domain-containing protein [Haloferax volcanii]MBS8130880.1 VWA domain-containing protein [Haloferax volcanii]
MTTQTLPFSAIVGQDELKQALLAVGANDDLDGLLVRGEKGTAKSTAVRALSDLLPEQAVVADCPYGCPPDPDDPARQCDSCRARDDPAVERRSVPLVTLPLGATRDRVAGTLSVADALDGEASFDPGLLARANRGILYVDEVNLLDDHLVDLLLDAAASGVNRVERDGMSVEHPAEFTLVGTMNPEEGDLRPQLRDRFALQATVVGSRDVDDRVEIIDRALAGGDDPETVADAHREGTAALETALREATARLDSVALPTEFKRDIAELCVDAGVEGHRADIAIARAARTLAALDGRTKVLESDVREAAALALPHRLQSRPFDDDPDVDDVLDDHFDEDEDRDDDGGGDANDGDGEGDDAGDADDGGSDDGDASDGEERAEGGDSDADAPGAAPDSDAGGDDRGGEVGGADERGPEDGDSEGGNSEDGDTDGSGDDPDEATPLLPGQNRAAVGDAERPPVEDAALDAETPGDGSRAAVRESRQGRGSRVRTEPATETDDIDVPASVRAAASAGRSRVTRSDLRTAVSRGSAATLVVFVVDASASMRAAMRQAKGTVLSLLEDAYEQRDEVAFVAVAGDEAEVLLPPTDSVTLAARHLKELPTGDRTPLPSGLDAARRVIDRSDADAALVVVVTDGRVTVADGSPTGQTRSAARSLATADASVVVVDAGDDGIGVTDILVSETDARRIPLSDLSAERVAEAERFADGQ